ncbi:tyrosine phosphatase family protein [Phreatobacter stygius]|uniref:Protein-tyrosine-phosphatase n=1 Tax=Phreatobacter stygius TaxID=1940610 RepID=A0A4D7BH05_9HYPH|nr:protein-tyrosine-phosphatase [Phreatobacter stygius]QCI67077.1 protein-tyrosine-phosphatase [Phreatobacter stygius]
MQNIAISVLTICGIDELAKHSSRSVTHVLSVLDPEWPELEAFQTFGAHHRTVLQFHDIIDARPGMVMPEPEHVAQILRFGSELAGSKAGRTEGHLLVHCHMGVSRSTAAMLTLLAQANPDEPEDGLFERLREIRPQAWPNSVMIGFADEALQRNGRLTSALGRHYAHQLKHDPRFVDWMTQLKRDRELAMAGA